MSETPAAPPAANRQGDATGFIDSLSALSAHIARREEFEASVRRGWTKMAAACGLLAALQSLGALGFLGAPTGILAVYASALATSSLAALLFSAAGAAPWRAAADSVDRVALRHEDSPLRDRIRITQWMLFDSALMRFAASERRVNAVIAHGVMLVSVMASFALALWPVLRTAFGDPADYQGRGAAASVALFLVLTLITIVATMRSGRATFHAAQHYARQVLAFDADFGGFLPRAEKEHVTKVAEAKAGAPAHADAA
jgi:hypothetical protein